MHLLDVGFRHGNSRKLDLDGVVEFEGGIFHEYVWELPFKVAQYVIWSTWVGNHTLACRFIFAATESAQQTNRRGPVLRNDSCQRVAFFG